ncbi:MAG: sugar ABC transporter permease [Chloroflexi bacterium]|nr:sugar ABC transporter permease [Chloroflexota bacterium]
MARFPFRLSGHQQAVLVLIPSVIVLAIFVYGFIGWTAYTSLTDAKLSSGPGDFIGLKNYTDLLTGLRFERFRTDMVNTVFFTAMFIGLCLGVGLLLAVLLDQKVVGEGVFRTIYLFPMALSFIVTGVVWKWLYHPTKGLNALPTLIGQPAGEFKWFISQDQWLQFSWQDLGVIYIPAFVLIVDAIMAFILIRWNRRGGQMPRFAVAGVLLLNTWVLLNGPRDLTTLRLPETHGFNLALIAVVLAASWQMSGYTMAMYLAGLRGIPDDLREAARVDGASEWQIYRYVILPLLQPITLSAMIILGHISLKIFDLIVGMGGFDNPYIDMPGVNMFVTAFRGDSTGRGAAIAMVLLVMVASVIVPYLRSALRSETEL